MNNGLFVVDSFDDRDYLSSMRYKIYSIEHGSSVVNPYDEDDSRSTAEFVAKCMGEATHCRWFVYDMNRNTNVYMFKGDS